MKAACLCGEIEFEFSAENGVVMNCHCSRCRRSHGAAFATQLFSSRSSLRFLRGEHMLSEYRSQKGIRAFCKKCGSRLMNYAAQGSDYMSVALAAVMDEHQLQPEIDVFSGSRADWYREGSSRTCYDTYPPNIADYL